MGLAIDCLGCGYRHDNLWSCERARLERERLAWIVADAAKTPVKGPEAAVMERPVEKTVGVSKKERAEASELKRRLVATEKKLADFRAKQRERTAKWRGKRKGSPPV